MAALQAEWFANASPEERAAAAHVMDHEAAEVTCPACATISPGGTAECPDCGLALM